MSTQDTTTATKATEALFTGPLADALSARGPGEAYGALKRALREGAAKDPLDALAVSVLGGSFLFYLAEKGHNPKVENFWDALVFVSTSLSVGYATTFAVTPAGKAIATALMSVGPALAAKALEPPRSAGPAAVPPGTTEAENALTERALASQALIAEKLDAILDELRRLPR